MHYNLLWIAYFLDPIAADINLKRLRGGQRVRIDISTFEENV
jgi:hypothetical protein